MRIHAADAAALAAGVRPGQSLADVRAALPEIIVRPAEITRDRAALTNLTRWFGRYGPARNVDGDDGAWIDATGVAHLFGGETALLNDLVERLARLGITARAGLADTLGAAHALARWGDLACAQDSAPATGTRAIAETGDACTKAALAPLPVAALRLTPDTVHLLHRLGLKRIEALYGLPRVALERRFRDGGGSRGRSAAREGAALAVLHRLDQALGLATEPRAAMVEPPETSARLAFAEPLVTDAGIRAALEHLAHDLSAKLTDAGLGARRFALALYRSDGSVAEALIGTSTACRDPAHVVRLLGEKLASLDAGLGIDVATLDARETAPLGTAQACLSSGGGPTAPDAAGLIDRLANRLGPQRIVRLAVAPSHIPERATVPLSALARRDGAAGCAWSAETIDNTSRKTHPPLLLVPPEPVTVVAEIPDGAPARLVWRRVVRRIVRTEGPERIAPEWWRALALPEEKRPATRDYYRLEDATGTGYWVFRDGLWGDERATEPRWFLQGVWA